MTTIRDAVASDIDAIGAMVEQRRRQYETYQPTFWRRAADSEPQARTFLGSLIGTPERIFIVAEEADIAGFLLAAPIPVPPVYDPGGSAFLIDDFCVADPAFWVPVGTALLDRGRAMAKARGAAHVIVVCGDADAMKAAMLRSAGLTIASNWWVSPI